MLVYLRSCLVRLVLRSTFHHLGQTFYRLLNSPLRVVTTIQISKLTWPIWLGADLNSFITLVMHGGKHRKTESHLYYSNSENITSIKNKLELAPAVNNFILKIHHLYNWVTKPTEIFVTTELFPSKCNKNCKIPLATLLQSNFTPNWESCPPLVYCLGWKICVYIFQISMNKANTNKCTDFEMSNQTVN